MNSSDENAAKAAFEAEYTESPQVIAKAPCRFHLIGENSWFFKEKTLSMAAGLFVYALVSKREDSSVKLYYVQLNERKKANVTSLKYKKEDKWANAIKSVLYGFTSGGFDLGGINVEIWSSILPSAGFGVTTAIKVCIALAVKKLFKLNCSDAQLLQVLERGNKIFLQSVNIQSDNFTTMFSKKGKFLVTDYAKNSWDYIDYPFGKNIDSNGNSTERKMFVIDTKVPRVRVWNEDALFEPQYALILGDLRERKEGIYGGWRYISNVTDINEGLSVTSEETRRRLLCIMREHTDLLSAVDALQKNDFSKFARAVNHSHESMRDLYESSCPEIDWLLKRMVEVSPSADFMTNPSCCGRIAGKGFARCLYVILQTEYTDLFFARLVEFEKIFGFHPECYEIFPSDGAEILD